jgi:hypothetical protein
MDCVKGLYVTHSACKIRVFFPSDHLLKIAAAFYSTLFVSRGTKFACYSKRLFKRRLLSISFNSVCYDMFDSS